MQAQLSTPGPLARTLTLVLTLALAACAAQPAAKTTAGAQEPASAGAEANKEKTRQPVVPIRTSPTQALPIDSASLEPPDGKWLVDDQGREYIRLEVPRVEGQYKWVGEEQKQVRVAFGLTYDVDSYDDEKIYVKHYRPKARKPREARPQISAEELEAAYKVETPAVDRLRLVPLGTGLPEQGQWRQGFDIADIDGDGNLDIVHGPARKSGNRPAIFLGDGKGGSWRPWRATFPNIPLDYGDAAAGDLDGDGDLDLVVASHLRGIVALVNDGNGSFRTWSEGIDFSVEPAPGEETATAFSSREVEIFDWNRDGRPDILALGEGPRLAIARTADEKSFQGGSRGLAVYLNQGDGTWKRTGGTAGARVVFGDDLALGDFNGDGIQDFMTGSGIQGAKTLLNLGRQDGTWETVAIEALRPNSIFHGVAAGDFDRDGRADLAVGYLTIEGGVWRTGVDALLARPDGAWERRALGNEKSQEGIYGLSAGDLDGDGALDLVALTGEDAGWVFLGDGRGGFSREEGAEILERGCRGYHVELADLDGDGASE
ncbi:MAG: FG-GAP repeat domain-containing protein, partial [Thermoanaerobaculia bacterium]